MERPPPPPPPSNPPLIYATKMSCDFVSTTEALFSVPKSAHRVRRNGNGKQAVGGPKIMKGGMEDHVSA